MCKVRRHIVRQSGGRLACSSTAEDVAVQQMPRGMPSRLGETLQNVAEWQWKSRQPGDAVRRQAEDGTMVGGGAEDESRGGRCIRRRKTHQKAEDASGAEAESKTERHKGIPLTITPPPEKHRLNASLSNPLEHTLRAS